MNTELMRRFCDGEIAVSVADAEECLRFIDLLKEYGEFSKEELISVRGCANRVCEMRCNKIISSHRVWQNIGWVGKDMSGWYSRLFYMETIDACLFFYDNDDGDVSEADFLCMLGLD